MRVGRALLSVSDKACIVELGRGLAQAGVEIVSSGGTAATLAEAHIAVIQVAEVTGAPEMLGGRVKTLHPAIHAGILAERRNPDHMRALEEHGIAPIDLVVCNLYPFREAVEDPDVGEDEALELIDIGGPAMVRAAAKNWPSVAVVVNPLRYAELLDAISGSGEGHEAASDPGAELRIPAELRRELALEAFDHTAAYDAAIASYLSRGENWPGRLWLGATKIRDLRYGENPHQPGAFYRRPGAPIGLAAAEQLHGKELSYNNLLDADAGWRLVSDLGDPAVVITKHTNPCGAACGPSLEEAYEKAYRCDPTSAFGGVVALNEVCDAATAKAIADTFFELVIAPDYEPDALEALTGKPNVRILRTPGETTSPEPDVRSVSGGFLLQGMDLTDPLDNDNLKVVTSAQPSPEQWIDLRFAWTVAKHVKSNAIVLAKEGAAVGIGAGQMSRVEAAELAGRRAGSRAEGSACASDAFFPFRDGLDAVVEAGARAVIQPGGSKRDDEVIAAADEHGIAMVFTGRRHFRH
jgi:phosphoribosylaminoimidazolecarboxamide formyltransferase / IMP cyclohydrolase